MKLRFSGVKFETPKTSEWKIEHRPGGWLIASRGTERRRIAAWKGRQKISLSVGGKLLLGEEIHEAHQGSASGTAADFTAQFPGKVRKILAVVGSSVGEDTPLILLEAMKMEFAIKAPSRGKVTKIRVTEGQQLSPGDILLDFEADQNDA